MAPRNNELQPRSVMGAYVRNEVRHIYGETFNAEIYFLLFSTSVYVVDEYSSITIVVSTTPKVVFLCVRW